MKITMRIIHRYMGFFLIGIISVYAMSGIILTYRNTTLFKVEKHLQTQLKPNINPKDLGTKLKIRNFKVDKIDGDIVFFNNGTYNSSTGLAAYKQMKYPVVIDKMTKLHKTPSGTPIYLLTTLLGISLLFLAISSLWMFKTKTKIFKQGIIIFAIGVVLTFVLILI